MRQYKLMESNKNIEDLKIVIAVLRAIHGEMSDADSFYYCSLAARKIKEAFIDCEEVLRMMGESYG